MQLPFSSEQFFEVFLAYNTAVWPAQVLLVALAVAAIVLVFVPWRPAGVVISAILACLWGWIGLVYHLAFFVAINPLAYALAVLSIAGAGAFVWQGVIRRRLEFNWTVGVRSIAGIILVLYALFVYPAISTLSGHGYPALPTFGLPCPTTLFTLGLCGFLAAPYPRVPLIVPVFWCFLGAQAAFLLGVQADLGLIVAGIFGVVLLATAGVSRHSVRTAP
jgi:hypothetical protein